MSYFDSVIGQERNKLHIKTMLTEGCLPHSILIYGERGLGKLSMAKAIGSSILQRSIFDGALDVNSEIYVDQGQAFLIKPLGKSGLKINQWQMLLREFLTRAASGPRVVIIDAFETARNDFANAILKSIEEPPTQVYFILLTTKKNLVLPTILSRCMLLPMMEVGNETLLLALQSEGYDLQSNEAVMLSQGNYGRAKEFLEKADKNMLKIAVDWIEIITVSEQPFTDGVLILNNLNRDDLKQVFGWLRMLARDMMALQFTSNEALMQFPNLIKRLKNGLKGQNKQRWSCKALKCIFEETIKGEQALRLNIRPALVVDALVINIIKALKE